MAPIDFSMASLVHEHLLQKGVHLYLEKAVASFERTVNGLEVVFKSGERLPADMVLLSIGGTSQYLIGDRGWTGDRGDARY